MPVSPTYPGVYIEEVPSGVRTITGVATSIAAFLGRTSKGPINKAVRILSPTDYERQFGEPHSLSDLAHSVRHFFANGGSDCYVVRLARDAVAASVNLENLNGQTVLVATAKAEGAWGNTIRLEVDYNTPRPDETFNLRVIHEEGGQEVNQEVWTGLSMDFNSARFAPSLVTQSSELIRLELGQALGDPSDSNSFFNTLNNSFAGFSNGRRPLLHPVSGATDAVGIEAAFDAFFTASQTSFDISVNDGPYVTVDLSTAPPVPDTAIADIETNLADKISAALAANSPAPTVTVSLGTELTGIGRLMTITASTIDGPRATVRVRRAAANDIAAALMLGVDQGGIEAARRSNFRPAPNVSLVSIGDPGTPGDLSTINGLTELTQNTVVSLTVNSETIPLADLVTTANNDTWNMNAAGASVVTGDNDGVREKLRIIASAVNNNPNLSFIVEAWGYNLALIATDGTLNNQPSTVVANSNPASATDVFNDAVTINVRQYSLGDAGSGDFSTSGEIGTDGLAPLASTYLGSEADQTGFHALDPVDLFNLMILPGDREVSEATMQNLWGPAVVYCQSRRAFLLVDPPASWTNSQGRPEVVQNTMLINDLRSPLADLKDYAAMYYPRILIQENGRTRDIAPSGAIAGLMARTDANRGVWKAPAGLEAGLRNISGVIPKLTDAENGVLNKKGVNCIRVFPGGIVSWGARTMDGDDDFGSEWKYIPVRRLALFLEESLFRGLQWVVFEPNDEPLWAQIRLNIGAFMQNLFRQGAFQGQTPRDAYFVKCDSETTTQNDINLGIVNILVGFAPLKPAEFVILKLQQMAGQIQV